MKLHLVRCRVRNFRSVLDSGLFSLSGDNITGIIGQNESGKTSILKALYSFHTGKISEEVLRSDGNMPEVTCAFKLPPDWTNILFPDVTLPKGLKKEIKEKTDNTIAVTRTWSEAEKSDAIIANVALDDFFIVQTSSPTPQEVKQPAEDTVPDPSEGPEPENHPITKDEFINTLLKSIPQFELFEDFSSLLPDTIDIADVIAKNRKVPGYQGAINLLQLVDIDINKIDTQDERVIKNKISNQSRTLTANFRDFWS